MAPPNARQISPHVLFLAGMIGFMTTAQLMFKLAGNHASARIGLMNDFLSNPWLWMGLLASGAGMVCWMLTLRRLPLSMVYPWTALIYGLTPLVSAAWFGELLSPSYLFGMACIVAGVFISAGGVDSQ